MKKILYVATVVKTHIMEFHIPFLKMLKEDGWETAVAARNDYEKPEECQIPYCDTYFDIPFERNPFQTGNVRAYRELKRLIDKEKYDIVHCHTPVGGGLARLAASEARKHGTKVIYTAHGFHFYSGAPLINWILYYPVERFLARYTDVLITIDQEDYGRAQKFKAKKVCYVPGVGIDIKKFSPDLLSHEEKERLRSSLGVTPQNKMILSVGELIPRKNHEIAIRAVVKIADPTVKYFICGCGELESYLTQLIEEQGAGEFIKLLGYRSDILQLLDCADLFILPSKQEGLSVALMEAIASKTAILCSNIRGNRELADPESLFELEDVKSLSDKIKMKLLTDNDLSIINNHENLQKFDLTLVEQKLADIYQIKTIEGKAEINDERNLLKKENEYIN